jgi:alginate O-acetyltransferase complex protein AlgI
MLFSSNVFLFGFLPLAWGSWFLIAQWAPRLSVVALIAISLAFYGYDQLSYLPLLILVSIIGYLFIEAPRSVQERAYWFVIVAFLSLLGYFKYFGLAVDMLGVIGFKGIAVNVLAPMLPVGISFFVLEAVSSVVDAKRGEKVDRVSYSSYLLFIAFFPHLIAGPIIRFRQICDQFVPERMLASVDVPRALLLIGIGLFLKVGIADRLAPFVDGVYSAPSDAGAMVVWLAVWSYSLQIYFDFNGYCVMAVGVALLFGISLPFNFNSPYKADSVVEFWRRWNVTLSLFLRDYVYRPLGGRAGTVPGWMLNLFLTMVVSGLWHGAGLNFVVWGAVHGIALVAANLTRRVGLFVPSWLGWALTLGFVTLAWIPFRAASVADAAKIFYGLGQFDLSSAIDPGVATVVIMGSALVLAAPNAREISRRFIATSLQSITAGAILGVAAMLQIHAGAVYSFIYFRF